MRHKYFRLFVCAILTMLGMTPSAAAFTDFKVQLTNADVFSTSVNQFGVKVAADGTYSATVFDDATATFTVKAARFNDAQHGWVNCEFTIPVEGPVKIGLGNCQFGSQDGTITDAAGSTTALTVGNANCWHNNMEENISYTIYKGTAATTLTVKYNGYCPFISVESVDPSQLASDATVTFASGEATGAVPAAVKQEVGSKLTLPKNFTLYVEGKTLTAWTDGTNDYAPGTEFIVPDKDITLTAKFTANEVSLGDRTEPVTAKWTFRRDQGAPTVAYQNQDGLIWVTQAEVNGKTIDVALPFSTNPGKLANGNWNDWAQMNAGTTFHVPSCKGATVSMEAYGNITTTTIDGQSDYAQGTAVSYEIANTAETIDVVIGDGSYYRYIQVVLPVVQSAGGESFDNVNGDIHWTVGNETSPAVSDAIKDAIANASVSVGNGLKVDMARYFDTDMVKYTPSVSNAGNTEGVMIEYRVKPTAGVKFKPAKIDYAAVKVGTDGATYSWSYTVDGVESSITEIEPKANLLRNNGSNGTAEYGGSGTATLMHTEIFESVGECDEFTFRFYISKTANNKNICIGNVTISGTVNGQTVAVDMFSLAVAASPEEGGSVSKYPNADEYEAGSEVTLTATENFGYDFVNWTNADGEEVSQEAKFKYTVNGNETLTANFKQVNTYELALTVDGTNDYMVTVNPAPTVIDGKWMYEEGDGVVLTASQYEGLVTFTNWSDGTTSSELNIIMDGDKPVTAVYSEADIIAGWDFYTKGSEGRKADFAAEDNDADALSLVNTETGETSGWLDKSYLGGGGYESFKGAAVNWRTGTQNGDVGNWHWQTKVNAGAFTDINVQFQMLYNYNAYQTYDVEYSLDGTEWTKVGSITMEGAKNPAAFSEQLPEACNNQQELYIRMKADKNSKVDGAASANDGNTLAMFFITGTPKLVNDGKAPVLVSTVPADGATGASASGKIVLTFDERIKLSDDAVAYINNTTVKSNTQNPTKGNVSGKTVTFDYKGLEYGTEYNFILPANSISDLTDNMIDKPITLSFTTMERPTVTKGDYDVIVSNVEELLAAINTANSRADQNVRFRIFIKKGTYTIPLKQDVMVAKAEGHQVPECITFITGKNISFIGEDRDATVITNAIPADATFAGQYGTTSKYDGIGNSDVFQISSSVSGLYWQDLTISTGMEDARGRDLAIQDKGTKNIYKNVCLHGYQDTWTSNNDNGLYYFEGGIIRGRTDYICGKGDIYFNQVDFHQIAGGYLAVPSKPAKVGWVMKDCQINGDGNDVDGNYTLGRPWGSGTPVALWIDTKMNVVPSAIGWSEMGTGWPKRFAEYNSMTKTGSQIDLSGRKKTFGDGHANNPVLTAEEAAEYSDMSKMYGDWQPTLATEQAPLVNGVKLEGSTLSWQGSDYALLYAVCKNGSVEGFTTETTYEVSGTDTDVWSVRAANDMGGLSDAVAAGSTDGIKSVANADSRQDGTIYTLQGVRVSKAQKGIYQKGIYIINGRKVVIK